MTLSRPPYANDSKAAAPEPDPAMWQGRRAALLANDQVRCYVLEDGGLIAHLGFVDLEGRAQRNALWEAPWLNEGTHRRTEDELAECYGDLGTGRFLQNFTGHALCLDSFGPASPEAVTAGSGLHGEASIVQWNFLPGNSAQLTAQAYLPFAHLNVERRFELIGNEAVLRVRESVVVLGRSPRDVHWVQHATVGPPLFGSSSRISTSARVGVTFPDPYDRGNLLVQGEEFVWPDAPLPEGGSADLRKLFAQPGSGFLVALRQPEDARYGFVAVTDGAQGISLIYVFASHNFPWLTLWEENRCRKEFPWMGDTQARGLEFGTTPWPFGNEANDAAGPLLDAATSRRVQPKEPAIAPWIVALAATPMHWHSLEDVIVEEDKLLLCCGTERLPLRAHTVREFLDGMEPAE